MNGLVTVDFHGDKLEAVQSPDGLEDHMTTPAVPTSPHTITLRYPSVMPTPPEGYRIAEYAVITRWPLIQREPMCDEDGTITPSLDSCIKAAEECLNGCLALEVVALDQKGNEVIAECPLGGGGTWSEWE